ncbi:MAG: hypothetical protein ACOCXA_04185 [Planctomycetota bacterium]
MALRTILPSLCTVALLAGAANMATAEEGSGSSHGLWLSFQTLPTDLEIDISDDDGDSLTIADDEEYESASRFAFGYRYRRGSQMAFVFSTGLAFSQEEFDDSGATWDITGTGVVLEPGISWLWENGFQLDAVGILGLGSSTADIKGYDEEDGVYAEFGLAVRPAYQAAGGFRVYADLGYLNRVQSWELEGTDDLTLDFDSSGFTIGAGVGYSF